MSDRWTDLLSDYLDGDVAGAERAGLEAHLTGCDDCRATLDGLQRVKARAAALVDPPAPDDLWAGIASRIGVAGPTSAAAPLRVRVRPARRAPSWAPLAIAAGFAVVLVSGGALWTASRHARGAATASRTPAPAAASLATFDAAQVEGEIADLQRSLDRGRGRLDPKTVAVLEKNLALIRQATDDAKRALAADPANRDLQSYFADAVGPKLELMKRAVVLAGV